MLRRGFEALERQTGQRPRGHRSPAWELSHDTFALLAEFGLEYDASQLGAEMLSRDGGWFARLGEIADDFRSREAAAAAGHPQAPS